MKKTVLLSLAAATALTFGATTNAAKAETTAPVKVQKVTYASPFQFFYQPMNQAQLNEFLASIFGKQITWKPIIVQPGNVALPQQPTAPAPKPAPAPTPAPKPAPAPTPAPSALSQYEQRVVDLTNAERAKAGLPALKVDLELSKVAKAKSQDMYNKNYFDHNSPTYGSPFDMMKRFGISYRTAGENIAMGQRTPEEVVQAWMNSAGHRANIMNNTYTHIGVGFVEGKNIWTQMFISK
ncbi:MAG: CAP domain-containing protein [Ectobacillus sp.]